MSTAFSYLPNLSEICYRGSEEQWNKTSMKNLFPNAAITFNYANAKITLDIYSHLTNRQIDAAGAKIQRMFDGLAGSDARNTAKGRRN